jgi:hypothetical protein
MMEILMTKLIKYPGKMSLVQVISIFSVQNHRSRDRALLTTYKLKRHNTALLLGRLHQGGLDKLGMQHAWERWHVQTKFCFEIWWSETTCEIYARAGTRVKQFCLDKKKRERGWLQPAYRRRESMIVPKQNASPVLENKLIKWGVNWVELDQH